MPHRTTLDIGSSVEILWHHEYKYSIAQEVKHAVAPSLHFLAELHVPAFVIPVMDETLLCAKLFTGRPFPLTGAPRRGGGEGRKHIGRNSVKMATKVTFPLVDQQTW